MPSPSSSPSATAGAARAEEASWCPSSSGGVAKAAAWLQRLCPASLSAATRNRCKQSGCRSRTVHQVVSRGNGTATSRHSPLRVLCCTRNPVHRATRNGAAVATRAGVGGTDQRSFTFVGKMPCCFGRAGFGGGTSGRAGCGAAACRPPPPPRNSAMAFEWRRTGETVALDREGAVFLPTELLAPIPQGVMSACCIHLHSFRCVLWLPGVGAPTWSP